MASLNQLVSEIAHSLGQPNNYALRENIRSIIIHERNEKIRRSYENHGYVDKGLEQRYTVSLEEVNDGDIKIPDGMEDIGINKIKKTVQKVPRPVRLINNLPFNEVSTVGFKYHVTIPFISESRARFRSFVPGLCGLPCYDYINDYIYLFPIGNSSTDNIDKLCIKSPFEHPKMVEKSNLNGEVSFEFNNDDDEWFLPEDMIGNIKDTIYRRDIMTTVRETNEIPKENLVR